MSARSNPQSAIDGSSLPRTPRILDDDGVVGGRILLRSKTKGIGGGESRTEEFAQVKEPK